MDDILLRDLKYLNNKIKPGKSNLTSFPEAGMLYDWTNENLKLYPKVELKDKRVLTVTASGDHVLKAIQMGATKIDAFDINVYAKYYSALKLSLIQSYGYYGFLYNINRIIKQMDNRTFNNYLNSNVLDKISTYLTEEELIFFKHYVCLKEKNKRIRICFYDDNSIYIKNSPCYGIKNYNDLKQKLKNANVTYYDSDLINVPSLLDGKKYDYIYLSNILGRVGLLNSPKISLILNDLSNILNNKGSIFSYSFEGHNHEFLENRLSGLYDITRTREDYPCVYQFTKK